MSDIKVPKWFVLDINNIKMLIAIITSNLLFLIFIIKFSTVLFTSFDFLKYIRFFTNHIRIANYKP